MSGVIALIQTGLLGAIATITFGVTGLDRAGALLAK